MRDTILSAARARWKTHTPAPGSRGVSFLVVGILLLLAVGGGIVLSTQILTHSAASSPIPTGYAVLTTATPSLTLNPAPRATARVDTRELTVIRGVRTLGELNQKELIDPAYRATNTTAIRTTADGTQLRTTLKTPQNPTGDLHDAPILAYAAHQVILKDDTRSLLNVPTDESIGLDETVFQTTPRAQALRTTLVNTLRSQKIQKLARVKGKDAGKALYLIDLPADVDPLDVVQQSPLPGEESPFYLNQVFFPDLTPTDPLFSSLYGMNNTGQNGGTPDADVDAPEAWDLETGDPTVVIADIDTGVHYTHPDLQSNIWHNPGEIPNNQIDDDGDGFVDDVVGWDFGYEDNDPDDIFGHGTHTVGTIAAQGNNGTGVIGMCWRCRVMPLQAFVQGLSGPGAFTTDLVQAIYYATDKGARITSNSWGGPYDGLIEDAFNYADAQGVLNIAAAGNAPDGLPNYPGAGAVMIAVAATDEYDQPTAFSSYYPEVDVAAPGLGIMSTLYPGAPLLAFCPPSTPDALYGKCSGTSMATPLVAGLAGLLVSRNHNLTNAQLKTIIRTAVDPIQNAAPGHYYGTGRVNAYQALLLVSPDGTPDLPTAILDHSTSSLPVNGSVTINGTTSGGYTLEYGTGTYPTQWTSISTGSTAVTNGSLGTLNTSTLADGYYTIRLSVTSGSTTATDTLLLNVKNVYFTFPHSEYGDLTYANFPLVKTGNAVTFTGGASGPNFQRYELSWESSDVPGSGTYSTSGFTLPGNGTTPIQDGTLGTFNTSVVAAQYPSSPVRVVAVRLRVYAANNQLVGEANERISLDPDVRWQANLDADLANYQQLDTSPGEPLVADLDGDGKKEICVMLRNVIHCYDSLGNSKPGFPVTLPSNEPGTQIKYYYSTAPLTAADVDGDGKQEVLFAQRAINTTYTYRVYAYRWNGTAPAGFPLSFATPYAQNEYLTPTTSVVAAQIIAGGPLEYVFQNGGNLHVFTQDGTLLNPNRTLLEPRQTNLHAFWIRESNFHSWSATPAVGNFDSDPDLEIVAIDEHESISNWGRVYVLNADGTNVPGWPRSTDVPTQQAPVVGDFDYDGLDDVAVGVRNILENHVGEFIVFNARGETVMEYPLTVADRRVDSSIAVTDLDNDDHPEFLFVQGIYGQPEKMVALGLDGVPVSTINPPAAYNPLTFGPHVVNTTLTPGKEILTNGSMGLGGQSGYQRLHLLDQTLNPIPGVPSKDVGPYSFSAGIIDDIDGDGDLELVAATQPPIIQPTYPYPNPGLIAVFDLPSTVQSQGASEWPVYQHDAQRTGRYVRNPLPGSPAMVTDLSASVDTFADGIHIAWTNPRLAPTVQLYRSTQASPACPTNGFIQTFSRGPSNEPAVIIQTVADQGLAPGQTYYYSLSVQNANGKTCVTQSVPGRVGTTPPLGAPTNFQASDGTNPTSIQLTWNAVSGATYYEVFRQSGTIFKPLNRTSGTLYRDADVAPGVTYTYKVRARNGTQIGPYSNTDTGYATAPAGTAPNTPTNVSATTNQANQITLTWTNPTTGSPATGIHVYRGSTAQTMTLYQTLGVVTAYVDTPIAGGTTYYYAVDAYNANGNSALTSSVAGSTPTILTPPAAPANIQASDGTSTSSVTITWSSISGADGYVVYRGTTNSAASAAQLTPRITATHYDDTTVTPGSTYWYFVRAVNLAGASGYSSGDSGYASNPSSTPCAPGDVDVGNGTCEHTVYMSQDGMTQAGGSTWASVRDATFGTYTGSGFLFLGSYHGTGGSFQNYRGLLRFDVTRVPGTLQSATVHIPLAQNSASGTYAIHLLPITPAFSSGFTGSDYGRMPLQTSQQLAPPADVSAYLYDYADTAFPLNSSGMSYLQQALTNGTLNLALVGSDSMDQADPGTAVFTHTYIFPPTTDTSNRPTLAIRYQP